MLRAAYERYAKEYEQLSDVREAPDKLINALQKRREALERNLEQLRKEHAEKVAEQGTGNARLAARELEMEKSRKEENVQDAALKQVREQFQRIGEKKVREFAEQKGLPDFQLDLSGLLRDGPGPEPDPFGPNGWRLEWRTWELKKDLCKWASDHIAPVEAKLRTLTTELQFATSAYEEARSTLQQLKKDIAAAAAMVTEKEGEMDEVVGKLSAIERSFSEPDPTLRAEIEHLQTRIRENEATRTLLFAMDIPTIGALLVASMSAGFRLMLLRGRFRPRNLAVR